MAFMVQKLQRNWRSWLQVTQLESGLTGPDHMYSSGSFPEAMDVITELLTSKQTLH